MLIINKNVSYATSTKKENCGYQIILLRWMTVCNLPTILQNGNWERFRRITS